MYGELAIFIFFRYSFEPTIALFQSVFKLVELQFKRVSRVSSLLLVAFEYFDPFFQFLIGWMAVELAHVRIFPFICVSTGALNVYLLTFFVMIARKLLEDFHSTFRAIYLAFFFVLL